MYVNLGRVPPKSPTMSRHTPAAEGFEAERRKSKLQQRQRATAFRAQIAKGYAVCRECKVILLGDRLKKTKPSRATLQARISQAMSHRTNARITAFKQKRTARAASDIRSRCFSN